MFAEAERESEEDGGGQDREAVCHPETETEAPDGGPSDLDRFAALICAVAQRAEHGLRSDQHFQQHIVRQVFLAALDLEQQD